MGLLPLKGIALASVQDSLPQKREINYDNTEGLQIPQFDQETLERLKDDPSFDYSEMVGKNWWTQFKAWLGNHWSNFWRWLLGNYEANPVLALLLRLLPYLIIVGIVAFVAWLFYRLDVGASLFGTRKTPEIFFSEEEEIIKNRNISELIEEALERQDFRLAVRYSYLLILQKLTEANVIDYSPDKTNSDYAAEIQSETLRTAFLMATNLYNHVWYGNFEMTAADFAKTKPIFSALNSKIPKAHE